MSTIRKAIEYPTGDGKPMAETDVHRILMDTLIETLQDHYVQGPMTYVSGNLLMFYEQGNRRRHVSPDVFVVHGVPKRTRLNYLVWEEGKGPDLVIELTSKSTRREDERTKRDLYRDVLGVAEYILFDPFGDYLKPPLQGYRLLDGDYRPIEPVDGRLPSEVLGLQLERDGESLRLFDPATGRRLPTVRERAARVDDRDRQAEELRRGYEAARNEYEAARRDTEAARVEYEAGRRDTEAIRLVYEAGRRDTEAIRLEYEAARDEFVGAKSAMQDEMARLRRDVEALRRQGPDGPTS